MLSWRARRQLVILLIIASPFAVVFFFFGSRVFPSASCEDNRKNQGEIGVDCGGPCAPCELKNPKSISLLWARFVAVEENAYDAAAEIQNPNEILSSSNLEYEFTLFDGPVPIAVRRGKTFILPQEKIHIVEPNMRTSREATRVELRILKLDWQFRQESKPSLVIEKRDYKVLDTNGKKKSLVETTLANRSPRAFHNVEVVALLLDKNENLLGVNKVIIESLAAGSKEKVTFIWPEELSGSIDSVMIEPRINILPK